MGTLAVVKKVRQSTGRVKKDDRLSPVQKVPSGLGNCRFPDVFTDITGTVTGWERAIHTSPSVTVKTPV